MSQNNRRVVVTGMATINPLGDTLESFYENLLQGKSGIKRWSSIDMTDVECKIGGDLGDYDVKQALENLRGKIDEGLHKKLRKLFRTCTFVNKMTAITSINAWLDAGLFNQEIDPFKTSVIVGGHNFNSVYVDKNMMQFREEPAFIDPLFGVEALDSNVPATVSEVLGVRGPAFTVGGACASGNLAMRDGFRDIITGECERAVVTAGIFDVTNADVHAMVFLNSVVTKPEFQDRPMEASRPFDSERCGFIPSHGTATLIIEDLETAKKRGAKIYAELLGVKANANASHLPKPSSEGQGKLMSDVLKLAGVKPEQVDYVCCHATGTPVGDIEEINAIKQAFGEHAYKLKLNAAKSMLGHTCWAAALVETIAGILQMQGGKLHPSINIGTIDPAIDLDVCANKVVEHEIQYMVKNSFGFGGLNCCSLYKRFEE